MNHRERRCKLPHLGLHGGELKCGVGGGGGGGKVAGPGGAAGVCSGMGLEALAVWWRSFLAAEQG